MNTPLLALRAFAVALSALSLLGLGNPLAAASPPPIAAFGTTPVIDHATLSTDGRLLASSFSGEQVSIVILDRKAKKITQRVNFDQKLKLRTMGFVSDSVVIAVFSITRAEIGDSESKAEITAVFALNALDGSSRQLLEAKANNRIVPASAGFLSRHGAAPGEILMSALITDNAAAGAAADSASNSVLSVDPLTGAWRVVEKGSRLTSNWLVDQGGRIVGRVEFYRKDQQTTIRIKDGDDWRTIHEFTDPDFNVIGLAADAKSVLAIGARGGERVRLWSIPFDGSGPQLLYEDPTYDVEGVLRDQYDRSLQGLRIGGLSQPVYWLDAKAENRVRALEAALPGRNAEIVAYTADGQQVLALTESRNAPGVYYIVDFANNRAEAVGQQYPQLARVPLGTVKEITYAARDGYSVPAYLTLPPGAEAKKLPLVVLPHGGPRARDSGRDFDWWSQFIASRGYAVLQPQFRGSTGFGQKHELAGYRQWGKLMQDDVTDGVQKLIADGTVDAARVCIVGASYGGYAALAGAAFTPELYRCSVSVAGVSDLVEMLRWVENRGGTESPAVRFWRKHIGKTSDPDVAAFSPARAAARVKADVMIMHGIDDTVVPYVQTEYMVSAMKSAGVRYELVQLKSEDHWLSRSPSRIEMLAQLERFLDKHLGAAAP